MLTYNDVIKQCTMLDSIDIGYLREAKYIRTFLGKLILLINRDPSMKIIVKKYCISNPYEVNRSDIQGRTPVFYALTISNIDICAEMIDFLCKNGANINQLLNNGDSILNSIMYVAHPSFLLLKVCLDNGADANFNILKYAFRNDFILEAKLLLEYDANTIKHIDSASYLEMCMDIDILNTKN